MNTQKINSDFIETKVEKNKKERMFFTILRDFIIVAIAIFLLLADMKHTITKDFFRQLILIICYLYGGFALLDIVLNINYRLNKIFYYYSLLDNYSGKDIDENEAIILKNKLIEFSENKMYLLHFNNSILNTVPITAFLGLLYYVLCIIID